MSSALLPALDPSADDQPDAVRIAGVSLSRADLLGAASAVATEIAGAPAIAVDATASAETVVAVVGGLLAGVPLVPLPHDVGTAECNHILRDSGAVPLPPVDITRRADWSPSGRAQPDPEATAFILYTSGTTGSPKGVLIPRRAVTAGLDALAEAWEWTPDDVLVHGLPLFHVHGLILGVLGPLRVGSRLIHTRRPHPTAYAAASGTLYFGVPTVWHRVANDPSSARALSGARLLVSGSAPLPASVFRDLERLTGQRPLERYGMTETLVTLSMRTTDARRPGTVGRPLAGIRARVRVEPGSDFGELEVCGATLFTGYLRRPEATAAAYTADGWFRTGDLAKVDEDGMFRITGRLCVDLIKSGGYRVGAGEIEDALLYHPGVSEVAVVGVPHEELGQEIVAYVVANPDTDRRVSGQELIDFVAGRLSVHKRPRRICFLEELPRNALGKPQKRVLLSM